ncbi:MAG: PfkB family carbohydrate kinase, partial [Betaproteobacteria bacterium]
MAAARASALMVVDDAGRAIGILTEQDIARRVAFQLGPEAPLAAAMTAPLIACTPDEGLWRAIALLRQHGLRHLPVLDEAGRCLKQLLQQEKVATSLHTDATISTTVKLRVIGRQQQIVRLDFEKTPEAEVLAAHLDEFAALLPGYDVVILSDYGKGGLMHITRMIERARAAGRPVLVDPKGDDYSRYAGATLITPNRAELREVVGRWTTEADLAARAQRLRHERGLQALLLTRSEEGMTLYEADGESSVAAQAREVFDVTGAGDTVIAVLAAMIAAGQPLREAVSIANRAGAIVVGKLGTATVSYEELFGRSQPPEASDWPAP